jgi:allophanate hydrolase subunit 2
MKDFILCVLIAVLLLGVFITPIIMLSDRQTVGGYAKIGTVITADLPKIAQSRPGMKIRFIRVSMDLAQDLYIRSVKEMDAIDTYLNA